MLNWRSVDKMGLKQVPPETVVTMRANDAVEVFAGARELENRTAIEAEHNLLHKFRGEGEQRCNGRSTAVVQALLLFLLLAAPSFCSGWHRMKFSNECKGPKMLGAGSGRSSR